MLVREHSRFVEELLDEWKKFFPNGTAEEYSETNYYLEQEDWILFLSRDEESNMYLIVDFDDNTRIVVDNFIISSELRDRGIGTKIMTSFFITFYTYQFDLIELMDKSCGFWKSLANQPKIKRIWSTSNQQKFHACPPRRNEETSNPVHVVFKRNNI